MKAAIDSHEPPLVLIAFDGPEMLASPADAAVEHHILLHKLKRDSIDVDKYFQIVLDEDGANWTFVYPPDYKGIADKNRRLTAF